MSLTFAQVQALEDYAAWSQIPANMRANFGALLGDQFHAEGSFHYPLQPLLRARALIYRKLLRRPFLSDRSVGSWRYFSQALRQRLPVQPGWVLMTGTAFLAFWPKDGKENAAGQFRAFWTDATFRQFIDYWPTHQSIATAFRTMGDDLERRAIHNTDLCVYSSKWAADSAINDYGVDPEKVMIAPFGPNLPAAMLEAANHSWAKIKPEIRILSVGVDWSRKGMDIAINTVSALRQRGLKVFLDIVGVLPPKAETFPAFVQIHGRLDKNDPEQQLKLIRLFETASAFILLSRADASPIVFSEAAAFGLPRFSFDTGGSRSLINDRIDGCLFTQDMDAKEIADRLHSIFADPERLMNMRQQARQGYETQWNWPTQCKKILERMSVLQNKHR